MDSETDWKLFRTFQIVANHLDRFWVYKAYLLVCRGLYLFVRNHVAPTLFPHQFAHAFRVIAGLNKHHRMLDVSVMGCGKTYTALFAVKWLEISKTVVIAPEITRDGWDRARKHFGIPSDALIFLSYSEFQRKAKPFLEDVPSTLIQPMPEIQRGLGPLDPEVVHRPTEAWIALCKNRLLLILDEIHMVKNHTIRTECVRLLAAPVTQCQGFILGMSATPYDKKENAVRLLQTMNIVHQPLVRVLDPFRNIRDFAGLRELTQFLNLKYMNRWEHLEAPEIRDLVFEMMSKSLKKKMYSHMCLPKQVSANAHNLFAMADEESLPILEEGATLLQKGLLAFMLQTMEGLDPLAQISRGMKTLERGKVNIFERLIRSELEKGRKVVIMMNYLDSIFALARKLHDQHPVVITGETKVPQRKIHVREFQQENWNSKLMICNTQVMGVGVDLDDKNGQFPRSMFLSPSYRLIDLHQACGRIQRSDTRSVPHIKFVYAKQVDIENSLLHRLAEKSNIVRSTANYTVLFPGDYPKIEEDIEEE